MLSVELAAAIVVDYAASRVQRLHLSGTRRAGAQVLRTAGRR